MCVTYLIRVDAVAVKISAAFDRVCLAIQLYLTRLHHLLNSKKATTSKKA
jgi:hypothetical protein